MENKLSNPLLVILGILLNVGYTTAGYCYYDDGYYICYYYYSYSLSSGAYAGIVIGCLIILAIKIGLIVVCCRRRYYLRNNGNVFVRSAPAFSVATVSQTNQSVGYNPPPTQYAAAPPPYSPSGQPAYPGQPQPAYPGQPQPAYPGKF